VWTNQTEKPDQLLRDALARAGERWAGLTGFATEQPATRLCAACFDGSCPIELPGNRARSNVIEHTPANAARTGANPASVV
jgi:hypothetical protein